MTAFRDRAARWLFAAAALPALLLAVAVSATLAAREAAASWLRAGMPDDAVIVSSNTLSLGPLGIAGPAVPSGLEDAISAEDGVAAVAVEESLSVPARVHGSLFGRSYGSDAAVLGADAALLRWIAPGVDADAFVDTLPLPVLVPRAILEAYNNSFADANGLPRLDGSAFVGRGFTLEAGASSLGASPGGSVAAPARIAGFSERRDLLGVIVPVSFVNRVHARLGSAPGARRLFVFARDPAGAERVAERMRARGLSVSAPSDRLRSLRKLDLLLSAILLVAASLVSVSTAAAAFFASAARVLAKAAEAELCHQLGMSRRAIVVRFAAGILAVASCGAAAGAGAALPACLLASLHSSLGAFGIVPGAGSLALGAAAGLLLPLAASAVGGLLGGYAVIPRWSGRS